MDASGHRLELVSGPAFLSFLPYLRGRKRWYLCAVTAACGVPEAYRPKTVDFGEANNRVGLRIAWILVRVPPPKLRTCLGCGNHLRAVPYMPDLWSVLAQPACRCAVPGGFRIMSAYKITRTFVSSGRCEPAGSFPYASGRSDKLGARPDQGQSAAARRQMRSQRGQHYG